MAPRWRNLGCASIPARELPVLADLRRWPGARVSIVGDRAWVCWDPADEPLGQVLIERLLPLSGAELFARREGRWYRPGEHLPAFGVPVVDGSEGVPLDRAVRPRPMSAAPPANAPVVPVSLRLVRDDRHPPRPAAAVWCALDRLADWAQWQTSARTAALTGAWLPGASGGPEDAEVLVLGGPGMLPAALGGVRFWGVNVLVPLGFRADPELAEPAARAVVGAGPDELVVLNDEGHERISRSAFRPLGLAGIRLAMTTRA